MFDNSIPEIIPSPKPLPTEDYNDIIAVRKNEIAYDPSVLQSHTGQQNIFKKTEVLAGNAKCSFTKYMKQEYLVSFVWSLFENGEY